MPRKIVSSDPKKHCKHLTTVPQKYKGGKGNMLVKSFSKKKKSRFCKKVEE